ncbi:craniofacial development protein 2-like [Diorhabda sublineata]|uniref:craniofacial development protein 2-like n=1 Tax=Diorhabda sublineata TaxID=1163346 RepID=UPI0024E17BB0|nr:craniofacial development protein 2-like [Diorhabda sublineata]
MNLGTWNVQGLSTKINEVLREIRQLNMDIVVLTETKKKGQGSENHYDHFYSGISKDKRAQKGVSILIKKSLRKYVSSWEAVNQRIIKINIAICGNKTTVIGTYGVNEDDTVNNKDDYFECLSEEISKVGTSREVIILGDLNARTGKKIDDQIVGRFGEEVTNDNGNRLITLWPTKYIKNTEWLLPTQNDT